MKNSAFIKLAGETDASYEDLFTVYGVSFLQGSYIEFLKRSSAKDYVTNESRVAHGVQYVATPEYGKFNEKHFSVQILLEASSPQEFVNRFEAFQDKLLQGMFYLKIPSKHRVFKLVYSNLKIGSEYKRNYATFTLDLIEPNPKDRIEI